MQDLAELIRALAVLAWPVLLALFLYRFGEQIRGFIDSTRGRKLTVKVAGNELTVEEASEQQRHLISDLHERLAALEQQLQDSRALPLAALAQAPPQMESSALRSVLWVDDNPRNNSYLIASLQDRGIEVVTATSSAEAMTRFKPGRFDVVITDMRRAEGERAGIDLVRELRGLDQAVPVFLFCGAWAAQHLRAEALAAGATDITNSRAQLMALIDQVGRPGPAPLAAAG